MSMTDEELDRDWKPSGRRPQSTIARSFSQELMDIFRIENSVADLDEQVDKRKQQLTSQTTELEALEARIREMEKRLQQSGGRSIASSLSQAQTQQPSSPRSSRPPVANAFQNQDGQAPPPPAKDYQSNQANHGHAREHKYGARPSTARQAQQAVPGQLPPTPTASEDGDEQDV